MIATIWLKIGAKKKYGKWQVGQVHAFKLKPDTRDTEVAFKLTLDIPDEIFEEPVYEAKLSLPKVTRQFPESTEVLRQVEEQLTKRMGFRVKLEMPTAEPAEGSAE